MASETPSKGAIHVVSMSEEIDTSELQKFLDACKTDIDSAKLNVDYAITTVTDAENNGKKRLRVMKTTRQFPSEEDSIKLKANDEVKAETEAPATESEAKAEEEPVVEKKANAVMIVVDGAGSDE
jgi:hypothetical protein